MRLLVLSFILLFAFGIGCKCEYFPKSCDLLFRTEGASDFSEAISGATRTVTDSVSFVHVGILLPDSCGNPFVIEASPKFGVVTTPLSEFISDSPLVGGKPGVVVKRLAAEFSPEEVETNALGFLGQPYDWHYLPDNGSLYCSELVYECFLTPEGDHIFRALPMNFRLPDGTMPDFWKNLYGELGMEVPEGKPGTNPNELSRDPRLVEVYRYF